MTAQFAFKEYTIYIYIYTPYRPRCSHDGKSYFQIPKNIRDTVFASLSLFLWFLFLYFSYHRLYLQTSNPCISKSIFLTNLLPPFFSSFITYNILTWTCLSFLFNFMYYNFSTPTRPRRSKIKKKKKYIKIIIIVI